MKKALIYIGNCFVIVAATAAGHIVGEKVMTAINKKHAEKCAREEGEEDEQ